MKNYKDFEVWRQAMQLSKRIYETTESFPRNEEFGLKIQMRKAAASIHFNFAEGFAKNTLREFRRYSRIAYGSAMKLESQLLFV